MAADFFVQFAQPICLTLGKHCCIIVAYLKGELKMDKTSRLNIVIQKDLLDKVKAVAKANSISMGSQVRLILTKYCNENKIKGE